MAQFHIRVSASAQITSAAFGSSRHRTTGTDWLRHGRTGFYHAPVRPLCAALWCADTRTELGTPPDRKEIRKPTDRIERTSGKDPVWFAWQIPNLPSPVWTQFRLGCRKVASIMGTFRMLLALLFRQGLPDVCVLFMPLPLKRCSSIRTLRCHVEARATRNALLEDCLLSELLHPPPK